MKGRVLVVDDNLALSEMLGIVRRHEGLDVVHCAYGSAAMALFRESRPDVVLLDLVLPGIDGIEVCCRIRAESDYPDRHADETDRHHRHRSRFRVRR